MVIENYKYNVFAKRNANNAGIIANAKATKTSVFVNNIINFIYFYKFKLLLYSIMLYL